MMKSVWEQTCYAEQSCWLGKWKWTIVHICCTLVFVLSNVELGFLLFFGMIILYELLHCTDPGDSYGLFY